jgi:hypothetical protein
MGNVAYRFGSTLHTHASPTGITFLEKGANKLIMPDYQNGWKLPV